MSSLLAACESPGRVFRGENPHRAIRRHPPSGGAIVATPDHHWS